MEARHTNRDPSTGEFLEDLEVCMYTPSASGGHARYTRELLLALSEVGAGSGVKVSLVTSRDLCARYRDVPYEVHAILPSLRHRDEFRTRVGWALSRATHYFRRERAFLHCLESLDFDAVHFQEYAPWLAPRHFRWMKSRGLGLFYTVHNIYPHAYLPGVPEAIQRRWNRAAWRTCDALFVHTERLKEQLLEFLGPGCPPVRVTPHGIWVRSESGSSVEQTPAPGRLLFFGVIRENKGLHVLLEAMKRLEDCTLTVAGAFEDATYRKRVLQMLGDLPPGRVELREGFVEEDEAAGLFAKSALVVLPYTSFAAQSGVLHDALSHGVPVVATDVGALGESVHGWGVGEVACPGNATSLARAIRSALLPAAYEAARESVAGAREELSWTRTAKATIDGYLTFMPETGRAVKK